MNQDTICAVSTAPGVGGVAVIRVSGPKAIEICDQIFKPFKAGNHLANRKAYSLTYGNIVNENGENLDDVVVALFRAPHSFTAEDTVEITCHGSIYIQQQILQLLIKKGCRTATAGEFTQRAFLNGRMDLSQAEAVADLIASTSAATHKLAMNQMRGAFSNELVTLRAELLNLTSLIELELDFSEEEVEFADRQQLRDLADRIHTLISKLSNSFSVGNAIKNGIPVAIIGETNAGKSTLLNVLLKEERAIVSDIHGTTRDVIEDTININGLTFRFIDTAGIRDTQDKIESMGIELAFRKLEQASIVLWMIDSTQSTAQIEELASRILPKVTSQKLIMVFNKIDQISDAKREQLNEMLPGPDRIFISARQRFNTDELESLLVKTANLPEIGNNDVIVTNVRHYEALCRALDAINRVRDGLQANISGDFLSQDIRECMHYLGEITGQISNDEILGNIFLNFCIGK
ncbi:MAG: tRNA uridine-5-carboxymethylaminomethyl(34) synthesis GTPase MnmE [Bacteroidales bacterium]